jgi:hypothetical protein
MNSNIDAREMAEGLVAIHSPEKAETDIVFIHGLGGHPYKRDPENGAGEGEST